jgi:hypothetical protein
MKSLRIWGAGIALAVLALAGIAYAQSVPIPSAAPVTQGDYVQVIKNGAPSAQSSYAPAGAIGSMDQYAFNTPLTGFTLTGTSYTSLLYLTPAGTLATGTVTMPAQENDGQRFCIASSQTQTALTVTANTGQTIVGTAVTALVIGTQVCWVYRASTLSWYRVA